MALKKSLEHASGLVVEDAYWKVEAVSGGKDHLLIRCECYLNESTAKDTVDAEGNFITRKRQPLYSFTQAFKPSVAEGSENFIKQAYEYLKTLPEFIDAIDC